MPLDFSKIYDRFLIEFIDKSNRRQDIGHIYLDFNRSVFSTFYTFSVMGGLTLKGGSDPQTIWKELHSIQDMLKKHGRRLSGVVLFKSEDEIIMYEADHKGLSQKKAIFP